MDSGVPRPYAPGVTVETRSRPSLVLDTWAAMLRPRRSVAIAAVALPLLYGQSVWNADPVSGVAAGLVLCVGTVVIAPAAWRVLGGSGLGLVAYVGVGALSLWVLALVLPRAGGFEDRFLAQANTLPFLLGLFLVGGFGLGRDVDDERRLARERARLEALSRDKERAELLAMRAQLDPHFLFNTLNAIAEWCATDPAVAERAILRLAELLRTVLGAVREPWWPLADEIALCEAVLELHRIRDPGRFASVVDAEAIDGVVPPMILLPLVENAVKHGPAAGHAGEVTVRVRASGDEVRVEVRNPGPFAGPRDGGHGLDLVRRRLALAYDDRATFAIGQDGDGTRAVVTLPRRTP